MGADENPKTELRYQSLALLKTKKLRGLQLFETLLEASQEIRFDKPRMMVDLADTAVTLARGLDPARYGARRVADCLCRALIEFGNACRVADQLDNAGSALGEAAARWEEGTRDELLQARLFDVQASLFADRRRFAAAAEALDMVHALHQRRGDEHLAARALISKGIYAGYSGDEEEGIRLLRQGLLGVDEQRDRNLAAAAVQCQASFLVRLGRFREARKLLWSHPFLKSVLTGKVNRLKLQWLESAIQLGLGDVQQGEEGLLDVKREFEKENLWYKAALVGLDLADLWYEQRRFDDLLEWVTGLVQAFRRYGIHREALSALMLLEKALAAGLEAGAILDSVSEFVRRAETDPELTFEGWFLSS